MELQLLYSMVITRAVNGLVDGGQQGVYALSVLSLAEKIGLPGWIVEIRHDSTHNQLPALPVLRSAAHHLMRWYDENYWTVQMSLLMKSSQICNPSASNQSEFAEQINSSSSTFSTDIFLPLFFAANAALARRIARPLSSMISLPDKKSTSHRRAVAALVDRVWVGRRKSDPLAWWRRVEEMLLACPALAQGILVRLLFQLRLTCTTFTLSGSCSDDGTTSYEAVSRREGGTGCEIRHDGGGGGEEELEVGGEEGEVGGEEGGEGRNEDNGGEKGGEYQAVVHEANEQGEEVKANLEDSATIIIGELYLRWIKLVCGFLLTAGGVVCEALPYTVPFCGPTLRGAPPTQLSAVVQRQLRSWLGRSRLSAMTWRLEGDSAALKGSQRVLLSEAAVACRALMESFPVHQEEDGSGDSRKRHRSASPAPAPSPLPLHSRPRRSNECTIQRISRSPGGVESVPWPLGMVPLGDRSGLLHLGSSVG